MKKRIGCAATVLIAALFGCAAPPVKQETVFFPTAPAPPRIQYLTSFSSQKDIEKESAFRTFVLGETEPLRLDKPYGVGVFDGKIYVCDTNQTVFVLDLRARTFRTLKGAKDKGQLRQPLNISIESDGTKYVTDPVRGQVVAFDRNDEYLKAYGTPGAWKPVDAVALDDWLYVADIQNAMVQVFDKKSGMIVRTIGNKGEPGHRLSMPTNIAFDSAGRLYVTDVGRFQIVKFNRDGEYDGVTGKLGNNPGHFARPRGIDIDREDRLFAVDASFNNVQIFNRQGQLLMFFGSGERGPGTLLLPAKVAVDYDNLPFFREYVAPDFEVEYLLFVTSQFGGRLVNVYGFGKEKGVAYPSDDELKQELIEKLRRQIREPAAPKEPGKPGEPVKADPGAPGPPAGPTAP